ncbi:hypothetical protein BJX61DRAFT_515861 [Aspergillus egyptiacus]|nr:hypothetical protein BJX61DRAFT_515861 [Aspergillus egyptiacus]
MRVSTILRPLWAVAIFSLGLVAAAPRGKPHSALSKRTTAYFCDSDATATLTYSFNEMIQMLNVAISRTNSLQAFLADPPNHITGQGNLLQSTLYTFESIFGRLEYGAGNDQNDEAIQRVERVLNLAQTMKTGIQTINSNPHLEIYCSDLWLISEDPEGDISLINPYLYWDNRETRSGPLAIDFEAAAGVCRDDESTHYAWVNPYLSSINTASGQTSVMTLCQDDLARWASRYQNGKTMMSFADQLFEHGQIALNEFQGQTLTTALMHELTHAPAIVGADYLLDQPCELNGQTTSAYGWDCITQLAKTPSTALKNADSFSFYITAMFLSKDDWSTGVSIPIPADVGPPDENGLASMMSQLEI